MAHSKANGISKVGAEPKSSPLNVSINSSDKSLLLKIHGLQKSQFQSWMPNLLSTVHENETAKKKEQGLSPPPSNTPSFDKIADANSQIPALRLNENDNVSNSNSSAHVQVEENYTLPPAFYPRPATPPKNLCEDDADYFYRKNFAPLPEAEDFLKVLSKTAVEKLDTKTLHAMINSTVESLVEWQDEYLEIDKRTAPRLNPPKKPVTGGRKALPYEVYEDMKEADLYGYVYDPRKEPGCQDPFSQRLGRGGGRALRNRRNKPEQPFEADAINGREKRTRKANPRYDPEQLMSTRTRKRKAVVEPPQPNEPALKKTRFSNRTKVQLDAATAPTTKASMSAPATRGRGGAQRGRGRGRGRGGSNLAPRQEILANNNQDLETKGNSTVPEDDETETESDHESGDENGEDDGDSTFEDDKPTLNVMELMRQNQKHQQTPAPIQRRRGRPPSKKKPIPIPTTKPSHPSQKISRKIPTVDPEPTPIVKRPNRTRTRTRNQSPAHADISLPPKSDPKQSIDPDTNSTNTASSKTAQPVSKTPDGKKAVKSLNRSKSMADWWAARKAKTAQRLADEEAEADQVRSSKAEEEAKTRAVEEAKIKADDEAEKAQIPKTIDAPDSQQTQIQQTQLQPTNALQTIHPPPTVRRRDPFMLGGRSILSDPIDAKYYQPPKQPFIQETRSTQPTHPIYPPAIPQDVVQPPLPPPPHSWPQLQPITSKAPKHPPPPKYVLQQSYHIQAGQPIPKPPPGYMVLAHPVSDINHPPSIYHVQPQQSPTQIRHGHQSSSSVTRQGPMAPPAPAGFYSSQQGYAPPPAFNSSKQLTGSSFFRSLGNPPFSLPQDGGRKLLPKLPSTPLEPQLGHSRSISLPQTQHSQAYMQQSPSQPQYQFQPGTSQSQTHPVPSPQYQNPHRHSQSQHDNGVQHQKWPEYPQSFPPLPVTSLDEKQSPIQQSSKRRKLSSGPSQQNKESTQPHKPIEASLTPELTELLLSPYAYEFNQGGPGRRTIMPAGLALPSTGSAPLKGPWSPSSPGTPGAGLHPRRKQEFMKRDSEKRDSEKRRASASGSGKDKQSSKKRDGGQCKKEQVKENGKEEVALENEKEQGIEKA